MYKRHLLYAMIYTSFLIEAVKTFYISYFITEYGHQIDDWIELVNSPIGIFLALIRLFEPYVWKTFKTEIQKLLPCLKTKKQQYSKESLDSFLNSCMNIEYVYLILVGISSHID